MKCLFLSPVNVLPRRSLWRKYWELQANIKKIEGLRNILPEGHFFSKTGFSSKITFPPWL